MNALGNFDLLEPDEPYPGVHRRSFSGVGATVTQYRFDPAAQFPIHEHPQEQITIVRTGEVRFTVGDEVHELGPGSWSIVPGNVTHGIKAGGDGAEILAILVPRRENADAYSVVEGRGVEA